MLDRSKPSQFGGADVQDLNATNLQEEEEKSPLDETAGYIEKISASGYIEQKIDMTASYLGVPGGNDSEQNRSADFGFNKSQLSGLSGNAGLTSQELTLDVLMRVDLRNTE